MCIFNIYLCILHAYSFAYLAHFPDRFCTGYNTVILNIFCIFCIKVSSQWLSLFISTIAWSPSKGPAVHVQLAPFTSITTVLAFISESSGRCNLGLQSKTSSIFLRGQSGPGWAKKTAIPLVLLHFSFSLEGSRKPKNRRKIKKSSFF